MAKRDVITPTEAEDDAINRGIAQDADNPEWTDADFAQAAAPSAMSQQLVRRARGAQVAPTKRAVSIRLDRDVLDRWKATGRGWQGRINAVLRRARTG